MMVSGVYLSGLYFYSYSTMSKSTPDLHKFSTHYSICSPRTALVREITLFKDMQEKEYTMWDFCTEDTRGKCKYSSVAHAAKVTRLESSCGNVTASEYTGRTVQSDVSTEVARRAGSWRSGGICGEGSITIKNDEEALLSLQERSTLFRAYVR